jgi:hypothetical protein
MVLTRGVFFSFRSGRPIPSGLVRPTAGPFALVDRSQAGSFAQPQGLRSDRPIPGGLIRPTAVLCRLRHSHAGASGCRTFCLRGRLPSPIRPTFQHQPHEGVAHDQSALRLCPWRYPCRDRLGNAPRLTPLAA